MKPKSKKMLSALLACALTVSAVVPQLPVLPASAEPSSANEETEQSAEPDAGGETAEPEAEPVPAVTTAPAPAEENESAFASSCTTTCTTARDDRDCFTTGFCCTTTTDYWCDGTHYTSTAYTGPHWNWKADLYPGSPAASLQHAEIKVEAGEEFVIEVPYYAVNYMPQYDSYIEDIRFEKMNGDMDDYEDVDVPWRVDFTDTAMRMHSIVPEPGKYLLRIDSEHPDDYFNFYYFTLCVTEPAEPVLITEATVPPTIERRTETVEMQYPWKTDKYGYDEGLSIPYPQYTDEAGNLHPFYQADIKITADDGSDIPDDILYNRKNDILFRYLDDQYIILHHNSVFITVSTPDNSYCVTYHVQFSLPPSGNPHLNWDDDLYEGSPQRTCRYQNIKASVGEKIVIDMPYLAAYGKPRFKTALRHTYYDCNDEGMTVTYGWYEFTDTVIRWHATALKAGETEVKYDLNEDSYLFVLSISEPETPVVTTAATAPPTLETKTTTVTVQGDLYNYQLRLPYPEYTDADGTTHNYYDIRFQILGQELTGYQDFYSFRNNCTFSKDAILIENLPEYAKSKNLNDIPVTVSTPDGSYCVNYIIHYNPYEMTIDKWNWTDNLYDGAPEPSPKNQRFNLVCGEELTIALPYCAKNHQPMKDTVVSNYYTNSGTENLLSNGYYEYTDTAILWHTTALKAGYADICLETHYWNNQDNDYYFTIMASEPDEPVQTTAVVVPNSVEQRTETVKVSCRWHEEAYYRYIIPYPTYKDADGKTQPYRQVNITTLIGGKTQDDSLSFTCTPINYLEYTADYIYLHQLDLLCQYAKQREVQYTVSTPDNRYCVTYIYTFPEEKDDKDWNWRSDRYDGAPGDSEKYENIELQVGESYTLAIPYFAEDHKPLYNTDISPSVSGNDVLSGGWVEFTDTAILWHTTALKPGLVCVTIDAGVFQSFSYHYLFDSYYFCFNVTEPPAPIQTTTVKVPSTIERRTETVEVKCDPYMRYPIPYPQYTDENGDTHPYYNISVTATEVDAYGNARPSTHPLLSLNYRSDNILFTTGDYAINFYYTFSTPDNSYSVTYHIYNDKEIVPPETTMECHFYETTTTETTCFSTETTVINTAKTSNTAAETQTSPTGQNTKLIPCDINADGVLDVKDGVLLMRISTEDTTLKVNDTMLSQADINQDSFIDLTDVQILLRKLVRK